MVNIFHYWVRFMYRLIMSVHFQLKLIKKNDFFFLCCIIQLTISSISLGIYLLNIIAFIRLKKNHSDHQFLFFCVHLCDAMRFERLVWFVK